MANENRKSTHFAKLIIAGGEEIGFRQMLAFEWKSFVNGGYIVRAKISDPNLKILKESVVTQGYLDKARQQPTIVKFKMG